MNLDKLLQEEARLRRKLKKAGKKPKKKPSPSLDLDELIKKDKFRRRMIKIQLEARLKRLSYRAYCRQQYYSLHSLSILGL